VPPSTGSGASPSAPVGLGTGQGGLRIYGHTQCGAVTAVTHAIHGKGHALERNIPLLVDNIEYAVHKAMRLHPDVKGDDIIPHAIEENVWEGIRSLFMRSPSTKELVKAGKTKVVGAIYDVSTGKISWLPQEKVTTLQRIVGALPAACPPLPARCRRNPDISAPGAGARTCKSCSSVHPENPGSDKHPGF